METLKRRMSNLKDRRLLEIINIDYAEYTEEALEVAKAEMVDRGIKNFQVSDRNKLLEKDCLEDITFRELIMQVRFEDVFRNLIKLYRIDKSLNHDLENTFNELILTDSLNINNTRIMVEEIDNIFDPQVKDWQVFGQDIESEEIFEIDYLEWKNWMSCLVNASQVKMIGKDRYTAHCLYCMTKHGFSQEEVNKNFNKMKLNQGGGELILDNNRLDSECQSQESHQLHPWLRFWARSIDYTILGIIISYIWCFLPIEVSRKLYSIERIMYLTPFIWIFIESVLISKTGTTIGKWIFNIQIKGDKGKLLTCKQSIYRSSLVWLVGLGFGIRYVEVVTRVYAYIKLENEGKSVWDKKANSEIIYGQIGIWRVLIAVSILVLIPLFQAINNF
jgi:hypothetical protein